jgi:hypothetical protein
VDFAQRRIGSGFLVRDSSGILEPENSPMKKTWSDAINDFPKWVGDDALQSRRLGLRDFTAASPP